MILVTNVFKINFARKTFQQSVFVKHKSGNRPEQPTPDRIENDTAERKEPYCGGKWRKKRGTRGRRLRHKLCDGGEISKAVEEEITTLGRITTRNMGSKHDPISMVAVLTDPNRYREAMQSPNSRELKRAMKDEIDSLLANGTWEVVPKPTGQKMQHSK
ncbi:hypothetical protein CCR75_009800 [Bremia lactucae]|uniref:Uncharacterized protein n=1 Tax=Bremia lactucae TaxID=4779 RepID=A0A976IL84_BRELC|nr:hypothetical protein CCR75_009800 [Bremia lactucae]